MDNSAIAEPAPPHDPAFVAGERQTLVEFLDYYRAVLLRKAAGLSQAELAVRLGPGSLTIGGLVKHMALVEDGWFHEGWSGRPQVEPWASVDWDADRDWDFHSADDDLPTALAQLFEAAVGRSRAAIADSNDLGASVDIRGRVFSLRWILVHMIEEYARHCGHADLIRESIDGRTGD